MITPEARLSPLDGAYHLLESALERRIRENTEPLFTTDAEGRVATRYVDCLPVDEQKFYNCHNCKNFLDRYGHLVTINEAGVTIPFLWAGHDELPPIMQAVVEQLYYIVDGAKVTGVFRWPTAMWGVPENVSKKTGVTWTHLHGLPGFVHDKSRTGLTPNQQIAGLKEDFGILNRSLNEYSIRAAEEALRVLESGALTRSEKAEGVARWFLELHRTISAYPRNKRNLIWLAVATAPPGFAHIRTTVISTLLDDILEEKPFAEVARRWSEKLHPLQYQRPQAEATENQIEAAERKVKKLGLERSFLRRYAKLEDVLLKVWEPKPLPEKTPAEEGGVFSALRESKNEVKRLELPPVSVSWRKFMEDVLPNALQIGVYITRSRLNFYGLTTAVDPEAPPIFQWDGLDGYPRNPVSCYVYNRGSFCNHWNLEPGWAWVSAIFPNPHRWQKPEKFTNHSQATFLAIPGVVDTQNDASALFPENLRTELHDIRAVVENYSKVTPLTGGDDGNANGLILSPGTVLRVVSAQGEAQYKISAID